jgi:hypothetical protein
MMMASALPRPHAGTRPISRSFLDPAISWVRGAAGVPQHRIPSGLGEKDDFRLPPEQARGGSVKCNSHGLNDFGGVRAEAGVVACPDWLFLPGLGSGSSPMPTSPCRRTTLRTPGGPLSRRRDGGGANTIDARRPPSSIAGQPTSLLSGIPVGARVTVTSRGALTYDGDPDEAVMCNGFRVSCRQGRTARLWPATRLAARGTGRDGYASRSLWRHPLAATPVGVSLPVPGTFGNRRCSGSVKPTGSGVPGHHQPRS